MNYPCPIYRNGKHDWSRWSNFRPVPPKLSLVSPYEAPTPEKAEIEAYRWRVCECGAGERETFAGGKREVFNPDEAREVYSRV